MVMAFYQSHHFISSTKLYTALKVPWSHMESLLTSQTRAFIFISLLKMYVSHGLILQELIIKLSSMLVISVPGLSKGSPWSTNANKNGYNVQWNLNIIIFFVRNV